MPADDARSPWRGLTLLAVALAAIMFLFPLTVSFPLLDPDEGLHASIAQEMLERGDWVTPRFLGQPFLDKPVFYFWVQAASVWLLGPNETAVRLPGLMFGLLGAITTGLLAWRMFDRTMGLIAGILYATTILPTALAQAASHDVALIPWINLTLLFLWESHRTQTWRAMGVCAVAAGVFLGLAVLTKGLFGLAVVGLAHGGYLLLTRRMVLSVMLCGMAALIVAALVAAPWYAAVEMRNPGYLRYFFLERHLLGLATGSQPHGAGPWWYYLPVLLGGGLPWIGYLPIVVQDRFAVSQPPSPPAPLPKGEGRFAGILPKGEASVSGVTTLLWIWLIGWTLLMMVAGSKLATYVWPVFPPMAVLAATAWAKLLDGTLAAAARRSFARTFVWSSWTGPILLPAAALTLQAIFSVQYAWPVWVVAGLVAAVAPLPLIPWRAGRWQATLATAALSLAAQFVVVITMMTPPVAEVCSARDLAEHFNRQGSLPQRLLVVEGRLGSLVFYLDPRLRAGLDSDRLQALAADELPPLRPGDVLAIPERKVRKLRGRLELDGKQYQSVGPYRLYNEM
jgi:4-amino-4-deoxy-L-arabinose transferase-like glycosyltransferase